MDKTTVSSAEAHDLPNDDNTPKEIISLDESVASNEEFIPDLPAINPHVSLN